MKTCTKSKGFDDITLEYYINGSKALRLRALHTYPKLHLSAFRATNESKSEEQDGASIEVTWDDGDAIL